MKDTKFAREGQVLQRYLSAFKHVAIACLINMSMNRFFKMMNDDELRAWYGEEHVFLAAERGAIGTLLISDRLFK